MRGWSSSINADQFFYRSTKWLYAVKTRMVIDTDIFLSTLQRNYNGKQNRLYV